MSDEYVAEVDAGRVDIDPDVDRAQFPLCRRGGQQGQVGQGAGVGRGLQPPGSGARGQQGGAGGGACEPGGPQDAVTHGRLGFPAAERGHEGRGRPVRRVEVDENEPLGVLVLRGTHQPPDRGMGEVHVVGPVPGLYGAAGHHHQAGRREVLVGEPFLDEGQEAAQGLPHLSVRVTGVGQDQRDHVRRGSLGRARRPQVGVRLGGEVRVTQESGRGVGGVTENRPDLVVRPVRPRPVHLDLGPVDAEERLFSGMAYEVEPVQRDRADRQAACREHRPAGRVGREHPQRLRPGDGEPDAERGRAGRVQGDVRPGERQPDRAGGGSVQAAAGGGVQGGVEERRVQPEQCGLRGRFGGEGDFGVHVVARPPGGAQALERRAVAVSRVRQGGVEVVQGDGLGSCGRPGAKTVRPVVGGRRQDTGGVPGPRVVEGAAALGTPVHGHGTLPVVAGGVDDDLELYGALLGDDQRCFQGEFGDTAAADLVPGAYRQLHEGRARQQYRPGDGVVPQPRVGPQGDPAGEYGTQLAAESHGGAQQGVIRLGQSEFARVAGRGDALQPEVLVLEGVRGEADVGWTRGADEGGPVDGEAVGVRLAEGGGEAAQVALVAAQGAQDDRGVLDRALDRCRQDRVGTGLDERVEAVRQQQTHRLLETDRLTQVGVPVRGVERGRLQALRRDRRVEGNPGRHRLKVSQVGQDAVADGFHLRRVGGVVHRDPARPDIGSVAVRQQRVKGVRLTRDGDRSRTVHGSHRHPALVGGEQLGSALGRDTEGGHASGARQFHDCLAAQCHDLRRVIEGERTRHARGGDLALRVTDHGGRPHAERLPQCGERHHHRPQHRLHHIHPAQPVLLRGPQDGSQLPIDVRCERRLACSDPLREHRRLVQQTGRHPHPLRPLPGEDEHRPPYRTCLARRRFARGQRRQAGRQLRPVVGQYDAPVLQRRPTPGQCPGDRAECDVRTVGEELGHSTRLSTERTLRLGRHEERERDAVVLGGLGGDGLGALFQDHVCVGAARPEGGHARPTGAPGLGPLPRLGEQFHRTGGPVHVRRRLGDVQGLRQHAGPHRHHRLDHTRHPGGGLRMTDVRLQ
ncbi:hypothetical protein GCM10018772_62410 [Streptomyces fumanus]|uniref:Uncharacterized protein n=1 Tax=Streptomyces fumanus TaxID=67302 RepID=A0A919E8C5_9ACTN|nr:hypothetical protein GCM10018772_62410 [Streptomyces fumanus]